MSHKHTLSHKIKKIVTRALQGLSLRRDPTFVPNLVMCVGVVFVWRGMWNLIDIYFFPYNELISNILAILIGVFIIYLPDNSFAELGGIDGKEDVEKEIAEEVAKIINK